MKKVVVASTNPVKINCVAQALSEVFPEEFFDVNGHKAPSGVSDQPMTNEETLIGAENRSDYIKQQFPEADFWVGIEGGIQEEDGMMDAFAWVVIKSANQKGIARTATFSLPPKVAELVKEGVELGHADDIVFGRNNSKQQDGAVGLLTRGLINRTEYYKHAMIMALIPFNHPELYS